MKCFNCQNEFEQKRSDAKFCSSNCRVSFLRKGGQKLDENTFEPQIPQIETKTKLVVEKSGLKEKPSDEVMTSIRKTNDELNKAYGAGTVMFFGDKPQQGYDVVSTGSLHLDIALGIGGLPRGRIVEIFGWESSGKSTIALNCIANAQKQGLKCLLVDAENAFDPEYADALGVNVDEMLYCQPSCGEQGLEVVDTQVGKGNIGVVVIDSVAALVPRKELEGEMGDSMMGVHARLMSQACRKLVNVVAKNNTLCIFINQFRHKIGVMHGSPDVTTGGNALQFYSSVRMEVRRSITKDNTIMNGDIKEGNQTNVKVVKNKCSPPFRTAQFNIIYGKGIDRRTELIDIAIEKGVIKKAGSWYSYNELKIGQGRDSVNETLDTHEKMFEEIEKAVLDIIKNGG